MTVFRMPEGVEVDLKVYLSGIVEDVETEIVIRVGGLPSFFDSVEETLDVQHIVKSYELDKMGTGWRVMTRAEIADYKAREKEDLRPPTEIPTPGC
jgi:hypothetical protein